MTNKSTIAKLILKNCVGCGACVESCPTSAIPDSLIGFISSLAKVNLDKYEDSIEELKQKGLIKWKK